VTTGNKQAGGAWRKGSFTLCR